MRISEIEKKTGVSRDTLRFYEKSGLLSIPKRTSGGYKVYSEINIEELAFIKTGQELGFSLIEIKHGLKTYLKTGKICSDWIDALVTKKMFFEKQIEESKASLTKIEKILSSKKIKIK